MYNAVYHVLIGIGHIISESGAVKVGDVVDSGIGKFSRVDDRDPGLSISTDEITHRHPKTSSPRTEFGADIISATKMRSDHIRELRDLVNAVMDTGATSLVNNLLSGTSSKVPHLRSLAPSLNFDQILVSVVVPHTGRESSKSIIGFL